MVYIARSIGLEKVADYWEQVLIINKHQRNRFSKKIINCIMENNLKPRVLILGWAFKKNTNDTRESAAIYVANNLINNNIRIQIYDPKVKEEQIIFDLLNLNPDFEKSMVNFVYEPFLNSSDHNVIAIMTEWDEFITYDWKTVYININKPAYIFDGRNILNCEVMKKIGFNYLGLGRK